MRSFVLALTVISAACAGTANGGSAPAQPASSSSASTASGSSDGLQVVATVAGEQITLAEVDAAAGAALVQAHQKVFEARDQALQTMIVERLVKAEAGKRGLSEQELLKAEVEDKAGAVDEAEARRLFAEAQARMPPGTTFESVQPRIEAFLTDQARSERMIAFADELKAAAGVRVTLEPPRAQVDVPATAPRFGSADAPVQIVEFSDFECPYCSKAADTVDALKEKYGDKISVVYRHFPLDFHQNAHKAAEASACAHDQGRFWEFHDKLFDNQRALTADKLVGYADELGLDGDTFKACLDSGKHAAAVTADLEAGKALGVTGTPGFFVNGRFLGGAMPVEAFSQVIDDELSRRM